MRRQNSEAVLIIATTFSKKEGSNISETVSLRNNRQPVFN